MSEDKDPWRFHKSINQKIGYQTDLTDYSIYVISKALSYHENLLVNLINPLNMLGWIDKELHYDFLFYGTPKAFRKVSKWARPHKFDEKDLEAVQEFYNCNSERASEALRILTEEQIKEIKRRLEKG